MWLDVAGCGQAGCGTQHRSFTKRRVIPMASPRSPEGVEHASLCARLTGKHDLFTVFSSTLIVFIDFNLTGDCVQNGAWRQAKYLVVIYVDNQECLKFKWLMNSTSPSQSDLHL